MEKLYNAFLNTPLCKCMAECSYVFGVSLILSTTFRWWTSSALWSIYSLYKLGRQKRWYECGGYSKNLCLCHPVIKPEFSTNTDWVIWCKTSCTFRISTFWHKL